MNTFLQNKLTRVMALVFTGACSLTAFQAHADDLDLNQSSYMHSISLYDGATHMSVGGGPITNPVLNGTPFLSPIYCVDFVNDVTIPKDYNATHVTNDGTINYNGNNSHAGVLVNNAGAVAWILDYLAPTATTVNQQQAIQVLIWHTIDSTKTADNLASYFADYNTDLGLLGNNTAALSTVDWFSPGVSGSNTVYQGLAAAVPVPAALFFVAPALIGVFGGFSRKSSLTQMPA